MYFESYLLIKYDHTVISLLSPVDVHCGKAETIITSRQAVLDAADLLQPEQFARHVLQ